MIVPTMQALCIPTANIVIGYNTSVRFIIYGAGGIGGYLWRTGNDTILIGRSGLWAGSRRQASGGRRSMPSFSGSPTR